MKRTRRVFDFEVPAGTRKVMVRQFVRAVDGTDYPQDHEVEVPNYNPASMTFDFEHGSPEMVACTEAFMLAEAMKEHGGGLRAVSTRDEVYWD